MGEFHRAASALAFVALAICATAPQIYARPISSADFWLPWFPFLPPSPSGDDPCAVAAEEAEGRLFPLRSALACLKSFPFNFSVADATIDTLLKTIPHYVFTDIAQSSPEPLLASNVSLEEGLKAIRASAYAGSYLTEYEFESAVASLFESLNDAHTRYRPSCFSRWRYRHGLVLLGVVEQGKLKIKLAPDKYQDMHLWNITLRTTGVNLSAFSGQEVVEIDGIPASDYITSFAQSSVGRFKDLNARFNAALFNVFLDIDGKQAWSPGSFASWSTPPENETITFLFGGNVTGPVNLPFLAHYLGPRFESGKSYFEQNCRAVRQDDEESSRGGGGGSMVAGQGSEGESGEEEGVYFLVKEVVTTVYIEKGNVGVIVIPTVSNDDVGLGFKSRFIVAFALGVDKLKSIGVEKVIIDLTQNGGGYIDLADWLSHALFPSMLSILPTRMRANPLAALAVKAADRNDVRMSIYHWSNWAHADDNSRFSSLRDGFYFPEVNITSGNMEIAWSQAFKSLEPGKPLRDIPTSLIKPFGDNPPFPATSILILTNGNCGSSCSIIASSLSQLHRVRTVTVGGIPGHPQQISNFPGSQVLDFEIFLEELQKVGLRDHPMAPQPFLRDVSFRFTWRALYGPVSTNIPLEFVFEPSTFNLDYNGATVTSQKALWEEVAKLF